MLTELNIKLNNFGPIGNADVDIGKINIVGGFNSTGKSTCSKMLYSLLRSNSTTRKSISVPSLVSEVLQVGFLLANFSNTALVNDEDADGLRDEVKDLLNDLREKLEKVNDPEK